MSEPTSRPAASPADSKASHLRTVGRFQLLRLLGKSARTMTWLVNDSRTSQELMLVLPRVQPDSAAAIEEWSEAVKRASRLSHPNLAHVVEVGSHDRWPYVAYDPGTDATLTDRLAGKSMPATEAVQLITQGLRGLAFAHDGGVAHRDIQLHMMLVSESGQVRLMGMEVALNVHDQGVDAAGLRAQRDAAQSDVLAFGLLLHRLLSGQAPLDEPDVGRVIERMPPLGRDIVRLPWNMPMPVPEAIRAIANRTTDRQERHRYRNARTLLGALEGWLKTNDANGGGPLALLLDRLRTVGLLPAMPGGAARAARMALMEKERTKELADVVLQDLALTFELLRTVNSAQVAGTDITGSGGPILTLRRTIAMVGLDGVRRAAVSLREWPGPLEETQAAELERLIERVKRAARLAQALRPAGYDEEVVYLVTLLQNLGRLVVQYHFADEYAQIRKLMLPAPAANGEGPDEPGMSEEGASFAVLGTDIEALGAAVAKHWGLDESVLKMIRRLPTGTPVRIVEEDGEMLRVVASCANEAVDALALPAAQAMPAMVRVAQRYARNLNIGLKDLQEALHMAPASARRNAGESGRGSAVIGRAAAPTGRAA